MADTPIVADFSAPAVGPEVSVDEINVPISMSPVPEEGEQPIQRDIKQEDVEVEADDVNQDVTDEQIDLNFDKDKAKQEIDIMKALNDAIDVETLSINDDFFKENNIPENLKGIIEAGLQAQKQSLQSKIAEAVGGNDNLKAMMEWGNKNLSEAEMVAYNNILKTGDIAQIQLASQGIFAKSGLGNKQVNSLSNGGASTSSSNGVDTSVFHSEAEYHMAMADPRYRTDHAYTKQIQNKLFKSDFFKNKVKYIESSGR